jgi:hypothetical protein
MAKIAVWAVVDPFADQTMSMLEIGCSVAAAGSVTFSW